MDPQSYNKVVLQVEEYIRIANLIWIVLLTKYLVTLKWYIVGYKICQGW